MAWTEKRGDRYVVRWREPSGKVRSKSFQFSENARAFRRDLEHKLDRGEYVDADVRKMPFGEYWENVISGSLNLRDSTRYQYEVIGRKHVLPHIGSLPMEALDERRIRALFAALQKDGASPAVLGKTRRLLSKVFRQALREGVVVRNPIEGIQTPREEAPELRILTPAEIRLLADAVDPRFRAMVLLAGYSGLRIGELGALDVRHLNVFRRRLEVTQAVQTAGGRAVVAKPKSKAGTRVVSIPGFVAEALSEHLSEYPPAEDGRIFSLEGGGLVSHQTFWPYWRRACKAAGVDARFHDLRHTAVALAIQQGAHPKQIQARMGHANIQMTLERYGHLFPGMDEDLADRMDEAYADDGKVVSWSS